MKIDGVTIPAGWIPTGDAGTKVAAADIEAAADIPLSKLDSAVCSETEADNKITAHAGDDDAHHTPYTDTKAATLTHEASDNLRNSNDGVKTKTGTGWTKMKEVRLNADLVACRLKFSGKMSAGPATGYARVYKNGVELGDQETFNTDSYVVKSDDFSGWVSGDLIQIYGRCYEGGITLYIKDMRFYYDGAIGKLGGKTLTTELTITDDPTISMTNQDP